MHLILGSQQATGIPALGNIAGTILGGQLADRLRDRLLTFAVAMALSGWALFTTVSHGERITRTETSLDGVQNKIHPGDPADKNLYPYSVKDHGAGVAVVWEYGTYTADTDNDLGIKGIGTVWLGFVAPSGTPAVSSTGPCSMWASK